MEFIDSLVNQHDDLVSLGCFSLIEGAVLYSSFAFLKHFQTRGKNKLLNVVRGINFSVRDENFHCVAGSWLFRSLRDERLKDIPSYRHDLRSEEHTSELQSLMRNSYAFLCLKKKKQQKQKQ